MSGVLDRVVGDASDAELIARVRAGDVDAYGLLFERHREAATRLAHVLGAGADADDLVADAFARVLSVLRGGRGPDVALRPYLLTAVRHCYVDRIRAQSRATPTDDLGTLDRGEPFQDTAVAGFESSAAARAFRSLPERWQLVLWHLEVEGQKPAEIAPLLGMSANAVSALAYRAREGLRQAFLQMHAGDVVDDECTWTRDMLGAYVRQGLSRRDSQKVAAHLESCRSCAAVYLELTEVNSELRGVLGPLLLGSATAGYLASTGASGGGTVLTGLGVALGRAKDTVGAHTQTALAVGATAVAGLAAAGIVLVNSGAGTQVAGGPLPHTFGPPGGVPSVPQPTTTPPGFTPGSGSTLQPTPVTNTGGSNVVPAVAVRTTTPQHSRGGGNSGTPGSPSTPPTTPSSPSSPPTSPPVNARTHLLSVGASLAPSSGAPNLSLRLGSNALKSLTKLQLVDVKVDLSGLIPGAKLDLDLLP
jgi:RNA polymerase sigma factor (sigma-70 family)